jgi:hypothetical protein
MLGLSLGLGYPKLVFSNGGRGKLTAYSLQLHVACMYVVCMYVMLYVRYSVSLQLQLTYSLSLSLSLHSKL